MPLPSFHWWRTVFWLIPMIAVYTIVLGAVSIASAVVDREGRIAHGCARVWSWLILATTGVRVAVRGVDRVERGSPYVFVSNHQSIYDIPVLFASLPFQLRILAKASLGRFPVLGWHLRFTGHLLVDRGRAGVGTLRQVAEMIRRGHSLIVFPEGTRSHDGRVGRFKRGVFLLAIESGYPVVPVTVQATRHVMRKGRLTTRPGDVALVVHDPIDTAGMARTDAGSLAERVRDTIVATAAAVDSSDTTVARGLVGEAPAGR